MENETPTVSVIMPFFNCERFLKEAIDGILSQTYQDFELLIINDGSTDSSQEIVDFYSDERINCIKQTNAGVAAACQKGLELAKGKYIMRHDADDTCLPEKLARQVEFLEKHDDIALVGTQIAFMTHSGKIAYNCRQPKNNYFQGRSHRLVSIDDFNPYSPITHATILARAQVLKELGGYRREFLTSEDTDLWLRLLDHHKAAVLNECDYFVRLNPTSATSKYKKTTNFYRNLAIQFASDRRNTGNDLLMRNEEMPKPPIVNMQEEPKKGGNFRGDLLNYHFKISLNAKDWNEAAKIVMFSIRDGWKLSKTWKSILFQLIGDNGVRTGVKIKSWIKSGQ